MHADDSTESEMEDDQPRFWDWTNFHYKAAVELSARARNQVIETIPGLAEYVAKQEGHSVEPV